MRKIKITAGLSSVDITKLGEILTEVSKTDVDYIHVDAMDMISHMPGASLTGGPMFVHCIRPYTDLPIEVHANVVGVTMLHVDAWIEAGANMITLPQEHYFGHKLGFLIERMKKQGCKAGLTISPGAPLGLAEQSIYWIDRLDIYTRDIVAPGGPLRESALPMITQAREWVEKRNLNCEICCDGGLNAKNCHKVIEAGADVIEMSRGLFGSGKSIAESVKEIRAEISKVAV